MAQELKTVIRLDDKQFKSIIDKVKSEVGNTETVFKASSGNIKGELKAIQGELANMLLNGVDPASEKFQQLAARAGSIKDAMGDAKAVVGDFANDVRGLAGITDVAGSVVGAFQVGAGAMAMFGVESENAQKILTQLAGAMSVLQGVTQLQNSFMDQSSGTFRTYHALLRLVGIEQSNNTATTTANTVAVKTNEASRQASTGALTASTGAIQGNTGALTASTTSTVANTTANAAAATATTGLSTAQKAAALASKGLKIALSSIGIGLVITLVASLVAHWEDIVGWFKKTFPQLNNLGSSFNKLKQVIYGVGNAVLQYILTPFRIAASVIKDLINGNWEGLVGNAIDEWKKGYDFAKNYQKGAHDELLSQQKDAQEKSRQSQLDALEESHKDYVAAHGRNLKELKQYHLKRLSLLKKGTKEWREANREYLTDMRTNAHTPKKVKTAKPKKVKTAKPKIDKAAVEAKRKAEKIADDQKTLKQTIETETVNNNKGSRKTEEEQLKNAYGSDKSNVINTQGALDNQLKLINDYYTKIEGFRQADLAVEIVAINKKYATLAKKAHDNKELLTQLEEQKQAAISNIQAEYANKYTELLDQRAKDEKEASDKLLNPLIDKARQLGQELGRSLDLKGLDFSALTKLTEELQKSVDGMKELQKVKDSLGSFENSGITRMLDDAKALQQILGSKMASDGEKIGASMVFMSQAIQQLGQDSAAAKAGLVLQAIGQIILGFAQASAQDSKLGVIGWVAAIAAGTAVMISTISQLQSFSQGGIFQGSKTVGDHNLARVNSGEMILTKTQQGNLFRILDNNTAGLGGGVGVSSVRVKGSDLYLALSNYSKVQSKTGRRVL
jgi:hypothetical protein